MPKFTNEHWGQAFRMYCNTTAWGYSPTYKQSGKTHTVIWENTDEKTNMGGQHQSIAQKQKDINNAKNT